jgi:uncharacterized membrane protein YhaH (DUF805 family)
MNGFDWYLLGWKRAFDTRGRSRRKEFGYFILVNYTLLVVLFGLHVAFENSMGNVFAVAVGIFILAIIVPKLTLIVRRLHDIGVSGWFCLLVFVPFVNIVLLASCLIGDGKPGTNKWGVNPKFS